MSGLNLLAAQTISTGMEKAWHLVTCEYPPQVGGVSDYSFAVARALAAAGHDVHVWCPTADRAAPAPTVDGVTVHQDLGRFSPSDLLRAGRRLDAVPGPSRLLVQWVPHGYGYRSLNLALAAWVARRALRGGTQLDLVVHEPYLAWSARPAQFAAACVHRLMLAIAAAAATRVWITIPAWEPAVRRFVFGGVPVSWLPGPSPLPVVADGVGADVLRRQLAPEGAPLVGHFGSYSPLITPLLEPALARLLGQTAAHVTLIGNGSNGFREAFLRRCPQFGDRVRATGTLAAADVSRHLQACDVMLQPYPDGVSSRRTTMVALLAHGKPVVANDGRLTDAIWRDAAGVELVPSADAGQLAAAVGALLDDAGRRARLGAAASRLHERVFDVAHIIETLTAAPHASFPGAREAEVL
jgi:glycosyltransferase involved in cell wall biosynthesis